MENVPSSEAAMGTQAPAGPLPLRGQGCEAVLAVRTPRRRPRHWRSLAILVVAVHVGVVLVWSDLTPSARLGGVLVATVLGLLALRAGMAGGARSETAHVLVGLVGLVSGVGVGVVQVVLAGPSVPVLVGVLAAAAGLALTLAAGAGLVRRLRGWRRLAALPIAYLVLQFVLLPVPVALYATHVPSAAAATSVPSGAEVVRFVAADGVELAGWYWPSRSGAAVVLRHGSGARTSKATTVEHARVLAAHGYGVLATDARGHGDSGGWAMDVGWNGDTDVAAAVDWLVARPEVEADRIAAVGLSMGGEEVLGAAGADRRIRAVVAEGVSGRQAADHGAFGYSGVQAAIDRAMGWVSDTTLGAFTRATRPTVLREAMDALGDRPVLLIAGDDPLEATVATALSAASPGQVTVWELPDTPHVRALARHPDAWERRVVGLLEDAVG